jgi:hypothetical protein
VDLGFGQGSVRAEALNHFPQRPHSAEQTRRKRSDNLSPTLSNLDPVGLRPARSGASSFAGSAATGPRRGR